MTSMMGQLERRAIVCRGWLLRREEAPFKRDANNSLVAPQSQGRNWHLPFGECARVQRSARDL
jgi:hypothetical protein